MTKFARPVIIAIAAVILAGAGFLAGRGAVAATTEPGSDADPLVSRSYLEEYVGKYAKAQQLQVVNLKPGQQIVAEGGAEIILRGGQAAVVTASENGLSDVTGGKDLARDAAVPFNHLLIVPRSDGRGIKATRESWVMVRGGFTVK